VKTPRKYAVVVVVVVMVSCLLAGTVNLQVGRKTEVGGGSFVHQPKTVYSIDPSQTLNALGSKTYWVFQKLPYRIKI
jgi:hypothetical protein